MSISSNQGSSSLVNDNMLSINSIFSIPSEIGYSNELKNPNIDFIKEIFKIVIKNSNIKLDLETKDQFCKFLDILFERYHADSNLEVSFFDKFGEFIKSENFKKIYYKTVNVNNITTNGVLNFSDLGDSINNLNHLKELIIIFEKFLVNWKVNRSLSNDNQNQSILVENKNHILFNGETYEIIKEAGKYSIIKSIISSNISILDKENNSLLFHGKKFVDCKIDNNLNIYGLLIISDKENTYLLDLKNDRLIGKEIFNGDKGIRDFKNIKFILSNLLFKSNGEIIIPINIDKITYFYNHNSNKLLKGYIKSDLSLLKDRLYDSKGNIFFIEYTEPFKIIRNIVTGEIIGDIYSLKVINPVEFVIDDGNIIISAVDKSNNHGLLNLTTGIFTIYKGLNFDGKAFTIQSLKYGLFKTRIAV